MPYADTEAVITVGPIVATYGAFHVRPYILSVEGRQPRQLPFYLILVELPPHPETAFAETRLLDASQEMVVRAVVAVLRLNYRELTSRRVPSPRGIDSRGSRTATATGPEADEERAKREADSRRFQWAARALGDVADVVYHFGEGNESEPRSAEGIKGEYAPGVPASDGEGTLEVVPYDEKTLVVRFGPFEVWREVDARNYLDSFPLEAWREPWHTKVRTHLDMSYETHGRVMPLQMTELGRHEGPVTRAAVTAAARGWMDYQRKRLAAAIAHSQVLADAEHAPTPEQYQHVEEQLAEMLAEMRAAVELLEAEERA